jgi:hypothetical protein
LPFLPLRSENNFARGFFLGGRDFFGVDPKKVVFFFRPQKAKKVPG